MSRGLTYKKFKVKAILSVKNELFACLMLYKNWIVRFAGLSSVKMVWSLIRHASSRTRYMFCWAITSINHHINLHFFQKKRGRRISGKAEWLRWHVASVDKRENWGRDSIKRSKRKKFIVWMSSTKSKERKRTAADHSARDAAVWRRQRAQLR